MRRQNRIFADIRRQGPPLEVCPKPPRKGSSVMTETTTATTKVKTARHVASSFGLPEMPKFEMPNMEMPEAFREMAEKGVRACEGHLREGEGGQRGSSRPARKHLCGHGQRRNRIQS